jgi:hypothetical protein
MIGKDHPVYFLEPLFAREGALFHFSRYVYKPDSLLDDRELLTVAGSDLTIDWFEKQFESLEHDQELAIHSTVAMNGRALHIPMLDFATNHIGPMQLHRLQMFLPKRVFTNFAFYNSGRSFHAYSAHLLPPKDWYQFLGRALLVNPRDQAEIIDARWVGHRLIGGYCSLRLSNNSQQYKGMPKKVSIRALTEEQAIAPLDPREPIRAPY